MNQDDQYEQAQLDDEIEIEAIGIEVSSQPIELYKVFKIANLVSGGGEAKHVIAEGYVAVNGELETRKRRKMYDGDFFEFNQEYYMVVCDAPVTEIEPEKDKGEKKNRKKRQLLINLVLENRSERKSKGQGQNPQVERLPIKNVKRKKMPFLNLQTKARRPRNHKLPVILTVAAIQSASCNRD